MAFQDRYGDKLEVPPDAYRPEPPPPAPAQSIQFVFVAGPIASNFIAGTRYAVLTAEQLFANGFVPFVPHFFMFYQLVQPRSFGDWMAWFARMMAKMDALVLSGQEIGPDSPEALQLFDIAKQLGKPAWPRVAKMFDDLGIGSDGATVT